MNKKLSAPGYAIDYFKEISTWVSSVLDLDNLLELIIDTATSMMQAKASSLLLLDQKTKKLYFKVATGEKKEEVMKYEVNLGQGIAGFVAEKGEPLLVTDVKKDNRWFKEISESIGFQTRSIACVPMKADGKVVGVVEIIDKEDASWRKLIRWTLKSIKSKSPKITNDIENKNVLFKDPYLTIIAKEMYETYTFLTEMIEIIEKSDLYKQIIDKIDYLQTKYPNMESDEAAKKAWVKNKYDIRELLHEYRDILEDFLHSGSDQFGSEQEIDSDEQEEEDVH